MTKLTIPQEAITADWDAPSNIVAFTTTRLGGVSSAPFDSLNLGLHVNDDSQAVDRNRQQLFEQCELPTQPYWLEQVHSTRVVMLNDTNRANKADGAIATQTGHVCAVMTADCMPLFLCNRAGSRVAVLHAGWQGMAKGVIEQGVSQFAEPTEEVIAWAGPTISQRYFEIGDEVKQQLGGSGAAYRPSRRRGKCYADLYKLAGERLANLGIQAYSHANYCTYADDDKFFSYRRDGVTGRMASIVYMR